MSLRSRSVPRERCTERVRMTSKGAEPSSGSRFRVNDALAAKRTLYSEYTGHVLVLGAERKKYWLAEIHTPDGNQVSVKILKADLALLGGELTPPTTPAGPVEAGDV